MTALRKEAEENHVPIILRDTEDLLESLVLLKKPIKILEIGAAVGYSSSFFASLDDNIKVTTIEADKGTYEIAKANIKKLGYEDRITLLYGDAREVLAKLEDDNDKDYDLVFIDAAKSHYKAFFFISLYLLGYFFEVFLFFLNFIIVLILFSFGRINLFAVLSFS